jgi:hypothetical protein
MTAQPRALVFEGAQIGPETTLGTAVPATKRLSGTMIKLNSKGNHSPTRQSGSRMPTGGILNKEWTEGTVENNPATFNDFAYLMAWLWGDPDISTVSGAKLHQNDPMNFTGYTPKPFTVEQGGYVRAKKAPGGILTGLGIDFSRDLISVTGDLIAQKTSRGITLTPGTNEVQTLHKTGTVTAGTFTLTFKGETTTALAFGATNTTIQSALVLLPNLSSAGAIAVTGGPAGTSDVVFTFGGQYASVDVPLIVSDSSLLTGGGTYDVAQTTPGAALSQTTNVPMAGSMLDFYVDTAAASWGNTKLTEFYKGSWRVSGLWGPDWTANTSNASWGRLVDLSPTTAFSFTLEQNATGDGYVTQWEAGTLIYPRVKITGPTLSSSTYLVQTDFCVELTDVTENDDQSGVSGVTYAGIWAADPVTNLFISSDIRCNLSSIA